MGSWIYLNVKIDEKLADASSLQVLWVPVLIMCRFQLNTCSVISWVRRFPVLDFLKFMSYPKRHRAITIKGRNQQNDLLTMNSTISLLRHKTRHDNAILRAE